jgi:hypothetical protein
MLPDSYKELSMRRNARSFLDNGLGTERRRREFAGETRLVIAESICAGYLSIGLDKYEGRVKGQPDSQRSGDPESPNMPLCILSPLISRFIEYPQSHCGMAESY